jgi:hypothetical protein
VRTSDIGIAQTFLNDEDSVMAIDLEDPAASPEKGSNFVETALKLGGKSEEEARTTGTLDRADEQVEAMFAPRYPTPAPRRT